MASLPQNMRPGVTYYVSLTKGLLKGTYKGMDDKGNHVFRSQGQTLLVPAGNIVGCSAVRS